MRNCYYTVKLSKFPLNPLIMNFIRFGLGVLHINISLKIGVDTIVYKSIFAPDIPWAPSYLKPALTPTNYWGRWGGIWLLKPVENITQVYFWNAVQILYVTSFQKGFCKNLFSISGSLFGRSRTSMIWMAPLGCDSYCDVKWLFL